MQHAVISCISLSGSAFSDRSGDSWNFAACEMYVPA